MYVFSHKYLIVEKFIHLYSDKTIFRINKPIIQVKYKF